MGAASDPREPMRRVNPDAGVSQADRLPVESKLQPVPSAPPEAQVTRTTVWLHRLSLVIFVIFCIELGMLLTVLPWTRIWTGNSLLAAHPAWQALARDNFARGVITGIGVVDVWIGIWEAVHYRDPGKRDKKDL
jgi:hypothetical protein